MTWSESKEASEIKGSSPRDRSIDRLRGLLVVAMVIGNFLAGVEFVPHALKHASDIGFTIADAVAPAFVFIIGLNFGPSFARRCREGLLKAYGYFARRYLTFLGIGAVISAGSTLVGVPSDWGVLQAIGVAGLIGLVFITLPWWARFIVGLLLLFAYQYLIDTSMLEAVLGSSHGGFLGAISWGALLVLSTAVGEVFRQGIRTYIVLVAVLSILGYVSTIIVPVSKQRVSLSFVLISLAISAAAFGLTKATERVASARTGLLSWWGENALALYLAHLVVLAPFIQPEIDWWHAQAPIWLVVIQLIVILTVLSLIAWWLQSRRRPVSFPA